ncbi:hypothetical protein F3Y22_tig00112740pilonHSYRG00034 [Hibiscus syriacus]|uniref:Uncharacterized protein n=1 Tax=Hibiscus syriacus TaxID=106335 RepID=A0A6A2X6P3_HIBSY|nr:hypothetical protein F3Y22_tig00112740pilonHSYRG00034 [Hibiscus syriacus]
MAVGEKKEEEAKVVVEHFTMESVEPQVDCFDACSTGCPLTNDRLRQRCEGKCRIRCGPDSMAEGNLG